MKGYTVLNIKKLVFETFHRCTCVHSDFILWKCLFKNETVKLVLVGWGSGDFEN